MLCLGVERLHGRLQVRFTCSTSGLVIVVELPSCSDFLRLLLGFLPLFFFVEDSEPLFGVEHVRDLSFFCALLAALALSRLIEYVFVSDADRSSAERACAWVDAASTQA